VSEVVAAIASTISELHDPH